MKKLGLFLAVLGLGGCIGLGTLKSSPVVARAEGDEPAVVEPVAEATVVLPKLEHGTITSSITEGNVGDICELDVRAEILYIVSGVTVNGTALVEDENIKGIYKFALVAGENKVVVNIVVNAEILGDLSTIYEQLRNKDWTRLFSVENVLILVKWVLDCGILIAIIRYYVRDKRLAGKLEEAVKKEIDKIIPESTKQTVIATIKEVLEPLFAQLKADNMEIMNGLTIFSKVLALAQEGTPESRVAILDLLSQLKLSDAKTLEEVKRYIDLVLKEHDTKYNEMMEKLNQINEENKNLIAEEEKPVSEEKPNIGDGTSI